MSERTALITARRDSEDNLIKTIVQLAAALIAVIAGFVSQSKFEFEGWSLILFGATLAALVISIVAGLTEQYYASKAHLEQQNLVENYFQKRISTFGDAPSNKLVRLFQMIAFLAFVAALLSLSVFAVVKAGENNVGTEITALASSTTTATASATSASASAFSTTQASGATNSDW